jgi:hypothetical protein
MGTTNRVLVTFNARNENDRRNFTKDLEESISEMDAVDAEFEHQECSCGDYSSAGNSDGGLAHVEMRPCVQSVLGGYDTHGYLKDRREYCV